MQWCTREGASPLVREDGCGQVSFATGGGFGGTQYTFDARSLELIGAYVYRDTAFGDCSELPEEAFAVGYIFGRALFDGQGNAEGNGVGVACPEVEYCTVCGDSPQYPPCP